MSSAPAFEAGHEPGGLREGAGPHVHLSPDFDTVRRLGGRRSAPVVLAVRALELHRSGTIFFLTGQQV
ncbi:MAG: hypothetical protein AB7G25_06210 [Sphingomonadaceae bacterium]